MPISRKPKRTVEKTGIDVEAFIQGGGKESVGEVKQNEKPIQAIKLRIPGELLEEIDRLVAGRKPSPSRHQWILEALYEKVEREEGTVEGKGMSKSTLSEIFDD